MQSSEHSGSSSLLGSQSFRFLKIVEMELPAEGTVDGQSVAVLEFDQLHDGSSLSVFVCFVVEYRFFGLLVRYHCTRPCKAVFDQEEADAVRIMNFTDLIKERLFVKPQPVGGSLSRPNLYGKSSRT